ncbi:exported protein of unknown function [Streptomyces sp. KY75]|nr:exported protein of unknown function [Streptomyces sp. KY70]CAD5984231.1 exported protein of unknown function [Streptomyces sp. KY75]
MCCCRSSTASRPAQSASADLPVPARPPSETMPTSGSSSRSRAIRCSALRPWMPKASRSPRTSRTLPSAVTRPSALPRSDWRTSPVWTGSSAASGTYSVSSVKSRSTCSPERDSSVIPVQPESVMASSARYSSARRPTEEALIRRGRSLETTVTSYPSAWRLRATARIRESLSPSRYPAGRTPGSEWLSSTRSVPPRSPSGIGASSRPYRIRKSSSRRRACRAKYPSSGWCRLASSSVTTTIGSTTSCSSKRAMAPGSASRTLVSRTYVRLSGMRRLLLVTTEGRTPSDEVGECDERSLGFPKGEDGPGSGPCARAGPRPPRRPQADCVYGPSCAKGLPGERTGCRSLGCDIRLVGDRMSTCQGYSLFGPKPCRCI